MKFGASESGKSDRINQRKMIGITGGAGFIGSNLSEVLINQGHSVICLDNFLTGRRSNLSHLLSSKRISIVEHDVIDEIPSDLPRFDEIYNLACPASPRHYQADPIKTALVCSQGTLHVLRRAARDKARVFHASTSEVYGDPDVHPQSESYWGNVNPNGPRACYDEGKRYAEMLVLDFARQFGIEARVVRIFNTYGPRMQLDDGRVVSNFIVQALKDEDITIYGDGSQTRSFCYVDDLVDGFLRLMASGDEVTGPVNIGNPNEITVGQLAEQVIAMTKSKAKVTYHPLPTDDPRRRRPDIRKAMALLGWSPKTTLAEGLQQTANYFTQQLEAEKYDAVAQSAHHS